MYGVRPIHVYTVRFWLLYQTNSSLLHIKIFTDTSKFCTRKNHYQPNPSLFLHTLAFSHFNMSSIIDKHIDHGHGGPSMYSHIYLASFGTNTLVRQQTSLTVFNLIQFKTTDVI